MELHQKDEEIRQKDVEMNQIQVCYAFYMRYNLIIHYVRDVDNCRISSPSAVDYLSSSTS